VNNASITESQFIKDMNMSHTQSFSKIIADKASSTGKAVETPTITITPKTAVPE